MVSYISASYVHMLNGPPLKNGVLGLLPDGTIDAVLTADEARDQQIAEIKQYEGILVPGFVNTHCHLELSHLRGSIAQHTGLPQFVQTVMKMRTSDEYAIDLAMLRADIEMFENGIVAVADISNQLVSKSAKTGSPTYYHTFIETMGFNPATAKASIGRAIEFRDQFNDQPVSIAPHAPYSVSAELFQEIKRIAEETDALVSIHNQETADENLFFEHKEGAFLGLYEFLGLDIGFYQPSGKTSLQSILPFLSPRQKTLLVHNTFTTKEDVCIAESTHDQLYWCLCPNANLYIENRLPDVNMLREAGLRITLGTDSLASNSRLSIFAEMQTLSKHFAVPLDELIRWATINGAAFLGITERYGSLAIGKRPGINLIGFTETNGMLVLGDWMKRLF
ncbi:amidohydrolase family protein [Pedobacter metabolipauper]|uniref:Cytosine/adenosine deaminase-related metal-dependent hydrolase n=1 Tax=Pedobacter metabolipauper TaxID=425513 RepID=A0A4R6SVX2_9SPHI|nr:amidohydrolase family protein [Pedobacter metabolipauper]TDQ10058.1 cytosine/adenosine deaminase-related metal-dependent hydrolase [Pedobacter metabolipauper]